MTTNKLSNRLLAMVMVISMMATMFAGITFASAEVGTPATQVTLSGVTLTAETPYLLENSATSTFAIKASAVPSEDGFDLHATFEDGTLTFNKGFNLGATDATWVEAGPDWNSMFQPVLDTTDNTYYVLKANGDLTIDTGSYNNFFYYDWTGNVKDRNNCTVSVDGDLTITGNGLLQITSNPSFDTVGVDELYTSYGIKAAGDVNLLGGTVYIYEALHSSTQGGDETTTFISAGSGNINLDGALLKFRGSGLVDAKVTEFDGTLNYNTDAYDLASYPQYVTSKGDQGNGARGFVRSYPSWAGAGSSHSVSYSPLCALSFETDGGSAVNTVYVSAGETIDLSAYVTTKEGLAFGGWYTDTALTNRVSSIAIYEATTLYAKWNTPSVYATEVIFAGQTLNSATPYLYINNWVSNGNHYLVTASNSPTPPAGDKILFAVFDAETSTLTFKYGFARVAKSGALYTEVEAGKIRPVYSAADNKYYGIKANGHLTIDLGSYNNALKWSWNDLGSDMNVIDVAGNLTIKGNGGHLGIHAVPGTDGSNGTAPNGYSGAHHTNGIRVDGDVRFEGGEIYIYARPYTNSADDTTTFVNAAGSITMAGGQLRMRSLRGMAATPVLTTSTPVLEGDYTVEDNVNESISSGGGDMGYVFYDATANNNNKTYVPNFTLTFEDNGADAAIADETVAYGTAVDLGAYAPTKDGYEFSGWYTNAELTNKVSNLTVYADTTLYAEWKKPVTTASELFFAGATINAENPYVMITTGKDPVTAASATATPTEGYKLLATFDAQSGTLTMNSGYELKMLGENDAEECLDWHTGPVMKKDAKGDLRGIHANGHLVIDLNGYNFSLYTGWNADVYDTNVIPVEADGNLTITGDGYMKLTAHAPYDNGNDSATVFHGYGLKADGNIYLNGGTVYAYDRCYNTPSGGEDTTFFYADGDIYLNGGVAKMRAKKSATWVTKFNKTPIYDSAVYMVSPDSLMEVEGSSNQSLGTTRWSPDTSYNNQNNNTYAPKVTLTFTTEGSTVDALTVGKYTKVDLTAYTSTKDGYNFDGWFLDGNKVESIILNGNKTVTAQFSELKNYVAEVDGTGFETFAEALAAITADSTIKLLADVEIATPINVAANLTIEGNDKTITYTGSDRVIDVKKETNGANLTISNLTVETTGYSQRGINYNTTGKLTLNDVVVTGNTITYAINLPGSSIGATVEINGGSFEGCIALNVWGANATVTATDADFVSVDNATHEDYAAISLNNDGTTIADGAVINIIGGSITAYKEDGVTPSSAYSNATSTGVINISDTTVVNGNASEMVAIIDFGANEFYSCASLQEAIESSAELGGTVKLLKNIEVDEIITIPENANIVIDLNSFTVTGTANKTFEAYGNLTVKNGTIVNTCYAGRSVDTRKAVTLNLEGVTLTTTSNGNNQPLTVGGSENGTVINLKDSTINAGTAGYAIIVFVESEINVVNSDLNGYADLYYKAGSANSVATVDADSALFAEGHTNEVFGAVVFEDSNIEVTINAPITMEAVEGAANAAVCFKNETVNTVAINGTVEGTVLNTFVEGSTITTTNSAVADAIKAEGYIVADPVEGVYGVEGVAPTVVYVAEVDGTGFETFAEALAAITADSTLKLLADVEIATPINVAANLTIEGNGKTLTYTGSDRVITVESTANGANLTINNLTVETTGYCQRGINYNTNGTLTLTDVVVDGNTITYAINLAGSSSNATVVIDGGSFEGCIALNIWGANATVTATDAAFVSVDNATHENYTAISLNNNGTVIADGTVVNITGGSITAYEEDGVTPSSAYSNATSTGVINISDTTVVNGNITEMVAMIDFGANEFYVYETLQAAIERSAELGGTVKPLKDIELSEAITVPAGATIVLDLNGKTVSRESDVVGEAMITNKGTLTITDTTDEKLGTIEYKYVGAPDTTFSKGNYTINNAGDLVIEAGTIKNTTEKMSHAYYTINSSKNVTINGGSILCSTNRTIRVFAGGNNTYSLEINDGYIEGTIPVFVQAAGSTTTDAPDVDLAVNGGKIVATDATYSIAVYSYSHGNSLGNISVDVTDGEFVGDIALSGGVNKTAIETVTITGGKFSGDGVYSYGADDIAAEAITITGGTFGSDYASIYCADDGYVITANGDGTFGVEEGYTLTFVTDGTAVESIFAAQGTVVDLSTYTTTKDGYTFDGWFIGEDLVTSITLNSDVTVTAKFTEIITGYTVSGTVTSFLDEEGDVTVELVENDTVILTETATGNAASYTFEAVPAGTYTLRVSKAKHVIREVEITVTDAAVAQDVTIHPIGDANGNGTISTSDALRANSHAQNRNLITDPYMFACLDVTGDGFITTRDVMMINAHAKDILDLWK